MFNKIKFIILIFALVISLLIVTGCTTTPKTTTSPYSTITSTIPTTATSVATTVSAVTTETVKSCYDMGEEVIYYVLDPPPGFNDGSLQYTWECGGRTVSFTVLDWAISDSLSWGTDSTTTPAPGMQYLWVKLRCTNIGDVNTGFPAIYKMGVLVNGDQQFEETDTYKLEDNEDYDASTSDVFFPGVYEEGWIVFDIPPNPQSIEFYLNWGDDPPQKWCLL